MIRLSIELDDVDFDRLIEQYLPVIGDQLRASGNPVGMLLSVPLTSVCKIWMETTRGGSKLAILLGPGRPKSRLPG